MEERGEIAGSERLNNCKNGEGRESREGMEKVEHSDGEGGQCRGERGNMIEERMDRDKR